MPVIFTLPQKKKLEIFVDRAKERFSGAGSKLKGGGVELSELLTSK